jgi:ADP-ribosylglycohydrolase
MLGLALGDAVGSRRSDIPAEGLLPAGAATQLAAWTAEGMLRDFTRYGIWNFIPDVIRFAYQRWAVVRGAASPLDHWHPFMEVDGKTTTGWLAQVPAMGLERGSSPSTLKALLANRPRKSAGCQALLRGLPLAILTGLPEARASLGFEKRIEDFAREVAGITHDDGMRNAPSGFAVRLAVHCLQAENVDLALRQSLADLDEPRVAERLTQTSRLATESPCVPDVLERLAPDKTAMSALCGGMYVALSFPDYDTTAEAVEFAGWAPDGDSVAAVAGACLGAIHGFEAFPVGLISRLELGWVMDTLARDLVLQMRESQAGEGWKGDGFGPPPLDPWWDTKYPGV